MMLRIQRADEAVAVPQDREFSIGLGSTLRADRLPDHAIIKHPGPINRGVEITRRSPMVSAVILDQVESGVALRWRRIPFVGRITRMINCGQTPRWIRGTRLGPRTGSTPSTTSSCSTGASWRFILRNAC